MTNTQRRDAPDPADDRGTFEGHLKRPLKYVRGMLLFDYRRVSEEKIRDAEKKYGRREAQAYLNHVHLFTSTEDLGLQRQWAFELIDEIRKKASTICPGSTVIGEIRDDGGDLEVTFWAVGEGDNSMEVR